MCIESLILENYRRFHNLSIDFSRRLNVFVGVNGAGKSSILSAIGKLLSWYVRRLVSPNGMGPGLSIDEGEITTDSLWSSIGLKASIGDGSVSWRIAKNAKAAPIFSQKTDLKELNEYVKDVREHRDLESVPVIVYYTVNRAVVEIPLRIKKHHDFSVLSAYDNAFAHSADFRRFFEWFREYDDIENERIVDTIRNGEISEANTSRELSAVRHALSVFLPEFKDWKIRRSPLRMVVDKSGEQLNVEQLSDGEKCIIAMVGDLARRLAMANPRLANPLYGEGVALIDEVELHLHPAWQKRILPRLINTFPNIQFIVSTHSPLVVAQLNTLLYKKESRDGIGVFALKDGCLSSLLDPDTGLVMSGEMDDVIHEVDAEFVSLLDGDYE